MLQCLFNQWQELAVDQQNPAVGVAEDIGDGLRFQTDIDRVQDRAQQRHPVVGFKQFGRVGGNDGHRVTPAHTAGFERARQAPHPLSQRPPGIASFPIDDRDPVGIDIRGPAEERQGGERDVIVQFVGAQGFVMFF